MRVNIVNVPAIRPTMPLYSLGVLANICNGFNFVKTQIFDLNLQYFDYIWSNNSDINSKIKNEKKYIEDPTLILKSKDGMNFEKYSKAINLIEEKSIIEGEKYKSKIKFGNVELEEDIESFEQILDYIYNIEKNPYFEIIDNLIKKNNIFNADVILLSVLCNEQLLAAFTTAYLIKKYNPNIFIYLGGAAIAKNKEVFSSVKVEFVNNFLFGKAEKDLINIFTIILKDNCWDYIKSSNNSQLCNNTIYNTDYCNLDLNQYYSPYLTLPIMSSRYCYYKKCAFCDNYSLNLEGQFINNTPENLYKYMSELNIKYGARYFKFIDDCVNPHFLEKLCDLLIEGEKKFYWQVNLRFSSCFLNFKLCDKLYKAGCRLVFLGLESYSQDEINKMYKGIQIKYVKEILHNFKLANIHTYISVIVGFPTETTLDFERTYNFLEREIKLYDLLDVNLFILAKYSSVYKNSSDYNISVISQDRNKITMRCAYKYLKNDTITKLENMNRYIKLKEFARKNDKEATMWRLNSLLFKEV